MFVCVVAEVARIQKKSIAELTRGTTFCGAKRLHCLTSADKIVWGGGNLHYPTTLTVIWVRSEQDLTQRSKCVLGGKRHLIFKSLFI